ncbi:MAG: hypothetical protein IAE67_08460 [Candidatus Competibacteraceae bacterium]|nr:hypothetical protein [Candidatus Competibacteraceae bacterium]
MNKTRLAATALIAYTLFSCGRTGGSVEDKDKLDTMQVEQQAMHDHDHEHEEIVLLDGKKWVVDAPMMVHIRNMEKELQAFSGHRDNEYNALATSLKQHLDLLTSNCTMEGQAHDELHKWLLPYIDLVDAFAHASSVEEKGEHVKELKASFERFNTYFE